MAEEPEKITTEEVRAGATPGMTRPILVVSLAIIIVLFAALLILYH